ncbi:MAG: S8 family peptidase [Elainellaceae cyanobacterium]
MSAPTSSSTSMQLDLSNLVESTGDDSPASSPQQVIVKLDKNGASVELSTLKQSLGIQTLETTQMLGFELWELPNEMSVDSLNQIKASGTAIGLESVEYIQANSTLSVATAVSTTTSATTSTTTDFTADPDFSELWGLDNQGQTGGTVDADIDATEAWDISTGQDVVVAVIDSGVDYTHPDLAQNMWVNTGETPNNGIDDDGNGFVDDYYGYDFANDDSDPFDDDGHGTHVAGTIAAVGDNDIGVVGVAPNAKIMALKFLDASGFGETFDAIQAIEYAILMGADISNNSWGGSFYSAALEDAIAAANDAGQLFVTAAGNSSSNNNIFPSYPANYDFDNVISVASTDANDELSWFSNVGSTSVDLAAPGSDIYSTIPGGGYASFNGTSMASPHVAGVAALLLAQNPDLTASEIKQKILDSVDPLDALDGLTASGGRLNAYNALVDGSSPSPDPDPDPSPDPDPDPSPDPDPTPQSWNFETGTLDGWNTFGDSAATDSSFGIDPSEGDYQGLVTSQTGSLSGQALELAIALPTNSLGRLGRGNVIEGSAIQLVDVAVEAGDTLTFDWNFLSDELPVPSSKDFGFVAIGDQVIKLADASDAGTTDGGAFDNSTGYETFSYTFDADDTLAISVGVVDVGSAAQDSGLLIDDVQINGSISSMATSEGTSVPAQDDLTGDSNGVLLDATDVNVGDNFSSTEAANVGSQPRLLPSSSMNSAIANSTPRDTIVAMVDGLFDDPEQGETINLLQQSSARGSASFSSSHPSLTASNAVMSASEPWLSSALPDILPDPI